MNTVIVAIIIALLAGTIVIFSLIKPTDQSNAKRRSKAKPTNGKSKREPIAESTFKPKPKPKKKKSRLKIKSAKKIKPKKEPSFSSTKPQFESTDDTDIALGLRNDDAVHDMSEDMYEEEITHAQIMPTEETVILEPSDHPVELPPKRIMLYIKADASRPYEGYELLQALLSNGLRFGAGHIFHRHQDKTGKGEEYFSLAAASQTGTFDLSKMGEFRTQGLIMFMDLHLVAEPMKAFNIMLETAGILTQDLGGQVLDDQQQAVTRESVIAMSQIVREYAAAAV